MMYLPVILWMAKFRSQILQFYAEVKKPNLKFFSLSTSSREQQVHLHISGSVINKTAANQAYLYYSHQNQTTGFLIKQIMLKMGVVG